MPTRLLTAAAMVSLALSAASIGTAILPSPAVSQSLDEVCQELWVERNSIYAENGYCFKTPRAISYFGNAGCRYDEAWAVPLSHSEQARIARIKARESALGCR